MPNSVGTWFQRGAEASPTIRIFSTAVVKVGLVDTLNASAPHTVFIPVDTAMTAYLDTKGWTKAAFLERADLLTFVERHIVAADLPPSKLVDGASFTSLANTEVRVSKTTTGLVLNAKAVIDPNYSAEIDAILNGHTDLIDRPLEP
jgi:uncharacterized surface protein with fasciclin (FAS1) repeats